MTHISLVRKNFAYETYSETGQYIKSKQLPFSEKFIV